MAASIFMYSFLKSMSSAATFLLDFDDRICLKTEKWVSLAT